MNKIETQIYIALIVTTLILEMEICIPKVNKEQLNKPFILNVFKRLELGVIKNVSIRENGCVFISFYNLIDTERNNKIVNRLHEGKKIYVIYDKDWGWFWKCCKAVKHIPNQYKETAP
jgi:hypothetical protein